MRNDARDELDHIPSMTTDARDRDDFAVPPSADHAPAYAGRGTAAPAPAPRSGGSTGALWALVGALTIALGGVGWWSFQQISLMEQQLVATQESFARISEEAAGRIQDISGKVVATESSVTSGSEQLKLRVKQLEDKLAGLSKQQQGAAVAQGTQDKRIEQLAADLKTQQGATGQFDGKLDKLANEQKAAQTASGKFEEQLKALDSDIAALKRQGNPSQAISRLEQDLLVLRSELDNRPAPAAAQNNSEFDAFRGQVTRNISALQAQVQNLQQQLNAR